jgi:hypothetical protein
MMTRKRTADWEKDFYKNGYPEEVIVIEDSPAPSPPSPVHYANAPYTSTFSSHVTRKRQAEQLPVIAKRAKLETMHSKYFCFEKVTHLTIYIYIYIYSRSHICLSRITYTHHCLYFSNATSYYITATSYATRI